MQTGVAEATTDRVLLPGFWNGSCDFEEWRVLGRPEF